MRALILVALLLPLAGCLSSPADDLVIEGSPLTAVQDRVNLPYELDAPWSAPLTEPLYDILDVQSIHIDVALPLDELGKALDPTEAPQIHMGLWLPDVPAGTKVPVIADVGPYYNDGDVPADQRDSGRLGEFLIQNFVPRGYAVAQVSVFGTGYADHCMDLMGRSEQLGVDAAVTFLGEAEWSNGNVGLIGRSYDGSTPWEAATFGNPHLKTIVPISGLIGMHELMWRNGSAEFRGPIMHNGVYGTFPIDSSVDAGSASVNASPGDLWILCRDYITGAVNGPAAAATGDHVAPAINDYWSERYFLDRALENYEGSVYLIHGMQDWNVDPHMAFPTHQMLVDDGLDVKGLYGQWDHAYPDRVSDHSDLQSGRGEEAFPNTVRMDWAQDLLEWFDHYLMETGPQPALHVEIQDNMGQWRIEETYPPQDAWVTFGLDEAEMTDATLWADSRPVIGGAQFLGIGPAAFASYEFPALDEDQDTIIAGMPQFHATVTPTGPGGQLFAELRDAETGLRLGHAIMDLRFANGDKEAQPVVPGVPLVAKMEFLAFDAVLPAGHGLEILIKTTGEDYLPSAVSDPVLLHDDADSVLKLPLATPAEADFFQPPTAALAE